MQGGIKVLLNKLAQLYHILQGKDADLPEGYTAGPRSPDMDMDADQGRTTPWQDTAGYATAYGNTGAASAWGGAATTGTPYAPSTPFGQTGWT